MPPFLRIGFKCQKLVYVVEFVNLHTYLHIIIDAQHSSMSNCMKPLVLDHVFYGLMYHCVLSPSGSVLRMNYVVYQFCSNINCAN